MHGAKNIKNIKFPDIYQHWKKCAYTAKYLSKDDKEYGSCANEIKFWKILQQAASVEIEYSGCSSQGYELITERNEISMFAYKNVTFGSKKTTWLL